GGQEQGAVAEMDFVDAQGAREVRQRPLPVRRQVDLADLPVEAVVEKAIGQFEMEIAPQGLAQSFHAHAVVEQPVDDRVADTVGVFGPRLDPRKACPEGLAAGAAGAVFSHLDFQDDDLAISDVADAAGMHRLAAAALATTRTGEGHRGALTVNHARAWLNS